MALESEALGDDGKPGLILICDEGTCIMLGGLPIVTRYPNFEMMLFFNDINLHDYATLSVSHPRLSGIPEQWNREVTIDGPV